MTLWAVKAPAPRLTPSEPAGVPHLLSSYYVPGAVPGWRWGRHPILPVTQTVRPLPTECALRHPIPQPLPKLGSAPSLPGPAKHPTPIQYPRGLPTLNENRTPTEGSGPSGAVPGLSLVTPSLWPLLSRCYKWADVLEILTTTGFPRLPAPTSLPGSATAGVRVQGSRPGEGMTERLTGRGRVESGPLLTCRLSRDPWMRPVCARLHTRPRDAPAEAGPAPPRPQPSPW